MIILNHCIFQNWKLSVNVQKFQLLLDSTNSTCDSGKKDPIIEKRNIFENNLYFLIKKKLML